MISDLQAAEIKFGDWLNIVSLLVTFIGFALTFLAARRAANEASKAVMQIKIQAFGTDLSDVTRIVEQIRILNRIKAPIVYQLALYGQLATHLSRNKNNDLLNDIDRRFLARILSEYRDAESNLEGALDAPDEYDWISVNRRLAKNLDEVNEILVRLGAQFQVSGRHER